MDLPSGLLDSGCPNFFPWGEAEVQPRSRTDCRLRPFFVKAIDDWASVLLSKTKICMKYEKD